MLVRKKKIGRTQIWVDTENKEEFKVYHDIIMHDDRNILLAAVCKKDFYGYMVTLGAAICSKEDLPNFDEEKGLTIAVGKAYKYSKNEIIKRYGKKSIYYDKVVEYYKYVNKQMKKIPSIQHSHNVKHIGIVSSAMMPMIPQLLERELKICYKYPDRYIAGYKKEWDK